MLQNLLQAFAIGVQLGQVIGQFQPDGLFALAEQRRDRHDRVFDQLGHVDRRGGQFDLSGIDGGDLHEIGQHAFHARDVGFDALQELALHRAQDADRFAQQQIGVTRDGRHGRAQLLRDRRDHFALLTVLSVAVSASAGSVRGN